MSNVLKDPSGKFNKQRERMLRASDNFTSAIKSERSQINRTQESAAEFFEHAGTDGITFLLISSASVACSNLLEMLKNLTPQESLRVYQTAGSLQDLDALPFEPTEKELLLAQMIGVGTLVNNSEASPYSADSPYELAPQADGSVTVTVKSGE